MIENLIGFLDDINFISKHDADLHGGAHKTTFTKTKCMIYNMITNNLSDSDNTTDDLCTDDLKIEVSSNRSKLMKTMLIPLPNSNTVSVGIFIKAGSRSETEAFGIAHFLEHMTFKGTIKRSSEKLMIDLDSIGANYNAMTGHEFTLYYVSGDPRDIHTFIDIITDLYLNPLYPNEDIEKERNVVAEELRMNDDSNNRVLSKKLYHEVFTGVDESMARPIIGFKDTILSMNRNHIINYRNNNYMGSNCLLSISGNFSKDDVLNQISSIFNAKLNHIKYAKNLFHANITSNPSIKSLVSLQPPKKTFNSYTHINKDINQTIISFFFNTYDTYNKYNHSVDLLADILSNGFSSRLFNLLRNKMGVSYYNNSFNRNFNDWGHFIINVGVDHKSVVKTIQGILEELSNIVKNGITVNELSKVKKQNETSLLFQFKDPYEYLMYYGLRFINQLPMYNLSDMLNNIESVSMDDMNKVIKQIFRNDNIIIGTIGKVDTNAQNEIENLIKNFNL